MSSSTTALETEAEAARPTPRWAPLVTALGILLACALCLLLDYSSLALASMPSPLVAPAGAVVEVHPLAPAGFQRAVITRTGPSMPLGSESASKRS